MVTSAGNAKTSKLKSNTLCSKTLIKSQGTHTLRCRWPVAKKGVWLSTITHSLYCSCLFFCLLPVLYGVNIPEMWWAHHRFHHAEGSCAGCADKHVLKHYIYSLQYVIWKQHIHVFGFFVWRNGKYSQCYSGHARFSTRIWRFLWSVY